MTKLVLDHDPLSGETVYFSFDNHTNEVQITHEQDVQKYLDYAHELSTDTARSDAGIKHDMWHYAHVPNAVIVDMKQKHGVNFFERADAKRVFELMNTEYKRFKVTSKVHRVTNNG